MSSKFRTPLISVITTTLNTASILADCLRSVEVQTIKDIEHIIIDGGSTDGTLAIVEQRKSALATVLSEKDDGIYDAMNKGIALASGKWLHFLGADDVLPHAKVYEELFSVPEIEKYDLIVCNSIIGNRVQINRFGYRLYLGNSLNQQGVLFHRRVFSNRRFDTSYRLGADYKINLQLLLEGALAKYISVPLCIYGTGGISSTATRLALEEECRVRREVLGLPVAKFVNMAKQTRAFFRELL